MTFVIGIDGGGTKTQLYVCDLQGNVLSTSTSGPSNILSCGLERTEKSIKEVLQKGVVEEGYKLSDCQALCIGVAGAGRACVKKQIKEIITHIGYLGKMIVTHDAETALAAGANGKDGVLIIAGTGAICYGRTTEGRTHRVSGWGHLVGDEGSAYSIGRSILSAVLRAYDGRGKGTVLTSLVLEKMGIDSPEQIISIIYKPEVSKEHIAAYAPILEEAILQQDEVAGQIADEAVGALVETAAVTIRKLDMQERETTVLISGSVLVKNAYIRIRFTEELRKIIPGVHMKISSDEAAYGAVRIALDEIKNQNLFDN